MEIFVAILQALGCVAFIIVFCAISLMLTMALCSKR